MSKITILRCVAMISLTLINLIIYSNANAANIFQPEIERAVDQSITAWISGNSKELKEAQEQLTLNEAYLLAIGQSGKHRSYLTYVPVSLNTNINTTAAYLFLLRKGKEGILLFPKALFEGRRFRFEQEVNIK